MSSETKLFLGIIEATLIFVVGAAILLGGNNGSTPTPSSTVTAPTDVLVRPGAHSLGPENAKVTIVEFSDFECPACQAAEPTVEQILSEYKAKSVRYIYREYPLPSHQYAFLAAQAAEAAGLQGKFWEMHNRLFSEFEKNPNLVLTKDVVTGYAKDLGLDTTKFAADLDSDAVRQIILNNQADGNKVGLSATPTFFINGKEFIGGLSLSDFETQINSRLK